MKEISLLIGNGFNRLEDPDFPNWDSLIKTPVKDSAEYVDITNMSYPLKFEYIVNFCNSVKNCYSTDTYQAIKKDMSNRLNESILKSDKRIDKDIAKKLREICPTNILTTNYDFLLEKVFISKGTHAEYSEKFSNRNKDKEFFLNRTRQFGKGPDKTYFYHVHGIDTVTSSICLGYEHYMRIVDALRRRLIGRGDNIRIVDYLKDATRKIYGRDFPNEYETKFFDSDIYIVGLGLTHEEIDLWWILCYRAYLYHANVNGAKELIKNKIVYLDVHPTKVTNEGYSYEEDYKRQQENMFKYMKVEYQPFEVKDGKFKEQYLKALDTIKDSTKL